MTFQHFGKTSAFGSALALTLALAAPAWADSQPLQPGTMPPAAAPDMRPDWNTAAPAAALQPEPRVKDAWLGECRRRMAYYYDDGRGGMGTGGILGIIAGGVAGGFIGDAIAGQGDRVLGAGLGAVGGAVLGGLAGSAIDKASNRRKLANRGYDYCEAYFDDYYRTAVMKHARHMMMAQPAMRPGEPICEEVVTESYVPIRTRTIRPRAPRRVVPDKRIRLN